MNRFKTSAFSAMSVAILMFAGCGDSGTGSAAGGPSAGPDTPSTIMKGMVVNLNAMADIFNKVTDVPSAQAAVPMIEATRANMRAVAARAKALPKMTAEEVAKSDAEAAKIMPDVMKTVASARMKLEEVFEKNPEVRKIIEPALKDMDKDMPD